MPEPWSAESAAAMRALLKQAEADFVEGDMAGAERRAKAISVFARAARDIAELEELARTAPPEDDEEARRAELRRRIAVYIERRRAGGPDASDDGEAAAGPAE